LGDVTAVANLELLRNIRDPQSEYTLYGILNKTKTRMGSRLLRANILQPPCGIVHYLRILMSALYLTFSSACCGTKVVL